MGTLGGKSPLSARPAVLVLADGTFFRGGAFGARGVRCGEVCFNTSMTGYQEIVTDPSYAGQIVVMTCTQIGNVGVNPQDEESARPWLCGFVVREVFDAPSNWRAAEPLPEYLRRHQVPGIAGIDTRALVRRIRDRGFQNGVISTDPERQEVGELADMARQAPALDGRDLASEVSCTEPYAWSEGTWEGIAGQLPRPPRPEPRLKLVAFDLGIKRNILRTLTDRGFEVTVVPAATTAAEVDALGPDAVFLSNGPGDPAATGAYAVPVINEILRAGIPLFGICLGHQMLALALGARTEKMLFGHRGANHPVKDLATGKVEITSQNHGFVVVGDSLPKGVRKTHVSLFDGSLEGLAVEGKPVFSVQYHPEASPGPHDSHHLFERFVGMMETTRSAK